MHLLLNRLSLIGGKGGIGTQIFFFDVFNVLSLRRHRVIFFRIDRGLINGLVPCTRAIGMNSLYDVLILCRQPNTIAHITVFIFCGRTSKRYFFTVRLGHFFV